MDLVGRRGILDQFEYLVAVDDGALGRADIDAHLEGLLVRQSNQKLAIGRLDVMHEVLEAIDQGLSIRLDSASKGFRVRSEKVGRAQHVNDLLGKVANTLLVDVVQAFEVAHRLGDRLRRNQVLLLQEVEIRMLVPDRIGETAILRPGILRRRQLTLRKVLLSLDVVDKRLAPVTDLVLQNLGRIRQQFCQIGRSRLYVEIVARTLQTRIDGLFLR